MYSDVAELVPTVNLPDSHHYIGPVTWSPSIDLPPWWSEALGQTRPRAYVTMGSTGTVNLLPAIIDACLAEGLTCLIATAGRGDFISNSPYVFAVEFLPGNLAAANADLVICNGGSPTSYQALQAGVPVFGVCSNLDQVMCMNSIQEAGAGQFIRAGEFTLARARQAMRALLCEPQYRQKSKDVEKKFKLLNPQSIFPRLIERQLT
jgi:UDP:flavonoid glycosyltransferase YjiC (YdhE family)